MHSFAKLIAKILSLRLAPKLGSLISPAQSAFLKTRCIHDSFLFVKNAAHSQHRRKKPALLFKMDIAKAFDSISWEYLLELKQKMGFPPRWRNWIALLLSSATSACLLNGTQGQSISHGCGFRQGDPLSPLLFILAIDPLHHLLQAAAEEEMIARLPGRGISMRVSLYADGAIIFANPDKEEIDHLMCILHSFEYASDPWINLAKSTATPINCNNIDLRFLLQIFLCPIAN